MESFSFGRCKDKDVRCYSCVHFNGSVCTCNPSEDIEEHVYVDKLELYRKLYSPSFEKYRDDIQIALRVQFNIDPELRYIDFPSVDELREKSDKAKELKRIEKSKYIKEIIERILKDVMTQANNGEYKSVTRIDDEYSGIDLTDCMSDDCAQIINFIRSKDKRFSVECSNIAFKKGFNLGVMFKVSWEVGEQG